MTDEVINQAAAAPVSAESAGATPSVSPAQTVTETSAAQPITTENNSSTQSPAPGETLLGAAEIKPAETKTAEATQNTEAETKAAEVTQEEASQSDEPAPLPTYEAFVLPEGFTADDTALSEFTNELAEFETLTKAEHGEVQKLGQKLVERHIAEMQKTVERLNDAYKAAWEQQKNDYKKAFENDPEIGGNRQETSINAALEFIRRYGGSETQQAEFRELMNTGVGNHPALIRTFVNAMTSKEIREGQPLPAQSPMKETRSNTQKMYGRSMQG